jgi:hypothetical protein
VRHEESHESHRRPADRRPPLRLWGSRPGGVVRLRGHLGHGIKVLDISDPTVPRLGGWYDTFAEEDLPEPPGDDNDDDDVDPRCLEQCIKVCRSECEGGDCTDACADGCAEYCENQGPGGPDQEFFQGAWGVGPFGNHIAVGDLVRGLVILDFHPNRVER